MWIAEKENVAHLIKDGEIVTKREYLVMLSSLGVLMTLMFYFLFTRTNCTFYIWFQNVFRMRKYIITQTGTKKPNAVVVFGETIMILWFFYILLLVVYDDQIAGDRHWATHVVAWGSLLWSFYLINRLLRLKSFDYAVRYAVPTVIIFWNFIEITERWGLFEENVVLMQHNLRLIKAFVEAEKQVDFFVYPMHEHNVLGKDRVHLMTKVLNYILEKNK